MNIEEKRIENSKKIEDNSPEFKNIFGLNLENYFNELRGFYLSDFADDLFPNFFMNEKTLGQVVLEKYGQKGVDLIAKIAGKEILEY